MRGRGRGEDGARVEIWVRPSGQAAATSSQRGGSESSRDSEQDGELGSLSASDVSHVLSVTSSPSLCNRLFPLLSLPWFSRLFSFFRPFILIANLLLSLLFSIQGCFQPLFFHLFLYRLKFCPVFLTACYDSPSIHCTQWHLRKQEME